MTVSLVLPSASATAGLRPLSADDVEIHDGFWGERIRVNRERTIPHGLEQLGAWGSLTNLRSVAERGGTYRAGQDSSGATFPFLDSDVYKWLEAVGWELGREDDAALAAAAGEVIEIVAKAQRADGYLNSYVQLNHDGVPAQDLAWGHEFYCIGHLIQAAVAWERAVGDDRLLTVARRAADWVDREFGPSGRDAVDGHPEIEPALVELYRVTGERRYLSLAARMIDLRGHGLLGSGRFGSAYWQDHLPVREAGAVAGHVVRQLYLDCGAVDVAVETGDRELLDAVLRRWHDMVSTRSYLTGALGSRHKDEAFGGPYELPPDRAYAETCAAISSVMLGWRLLLATGDAGHADVIERTMYNAVLPGVAMDGTRFFYVNPLQRRTHLAAEDGGGEREPWYPCACCPPNLMRMFSSWQQYLATSDDDGVQLHQFAAGRLRAELPAGDVVLTVETSYPWAGRVTVVVEQGPDQPWTLALRVPGWCDSATFAVPGEEARPLAAGARVAECRRAWRAGDRVTLDLDLAVRVVRPDHRVDAVRGCVAVERGPLVYCVESVDLPPGVDLEELDWDPARAPEVGGTSPFGDPVTAIEVPLSRRDGAAPEPLRVRAVPYYAWAHRGSGAMRVWIPKVGV